jgi:hypothetical protein
LAAGLQGLVGRIEAVRRGHFAEFLAQAGQLTASAFMDEVRLALGLEEGAPETAAEPAAGAAEPPPASPSKKSGKKAKAAPGAEATVEPEPAAAPPAPAPLLELAAPEGRQATRGKAARAKEAKRAAEDKANGGHLAVKPEPDKVAPTDETVPMKH